MFDRLVRLGSESRLSLGFGWSTDEIKADFLFLLFFFPLARATIGIDRQLLSWSSPGVHNLDLNHFWCRGTQY